MPIFDFLSSVDHELFFSINHLPHTPILEAIGIACSAGGGFIWFFTILIISLFFKRHRGSKKAILALLLAAFLTHITVSLLFKPWIARPRPDFTHNATITVINRIEMIVPLSFTNTDYAFPSGHATMAFAGAYILSTNFAKKKYWWYMLAFAVAVSRTYLGKHYPSDIIGGAALGILVGWMAIQSIELVFHTYPRLQKRISA